MFLAVISLTNWSWDQESHKKYHFTITFMILLVWKWGGQWVEITPFDKQIINQDAIDFREAPTEEIITSSHPFPLIGDDIDKFFYLKDVSRRMEDKCMIWTRCFISWPISWRHLLLLILIGKHQILIPCPHIKIFNNAWNKFGFFTLM